LLATLSTDPREFSIDQEPNASIVGMEPDLRATFRVAAACSNVANHEKLWLGAFELGDSCRLT